MNKNNDMILNLHYSIFIDQLYFCNFFLRYFGEMLKENCWASKNVHVPIMNLPSVINSSLFISTLSTGSVLAYSFSTHKVSIPMS